MWCTLNSVVFSLESTGSSRSNRLKTRDQNSHAVAVHLSKKTQAAAEQGLEWVRSLFAKFQRIQKHNTKALEVMAEMDRALGGEYIFDRAFLESSVRELSRLAHQVVYSLNAMSRNGYVALFDRYQSIKDVLDDILAGGLGLLERVSRCPIPSWALKWSRWQEL